MAKASNNPYPSLLIVEGSTPASPTSGDQRLFVDSTDHLLKLVNSSGTVSPIGGGAMVPLTSSPITVSGSTTSSVSFTSIPGTYSHLFGVWFAAADTSSGTTDLKMQFNGDTAGNYDCQRIYGSTTSVSAAQNNGAASLFLVKGQMPDSLSSYAGFAGGKFFIPNYANASLRNRMMNAEAYTDYADAAAYLWLETGKWRNTAAITQVTISVSTGHLKAGSEFWIYGVS